MKVIFHKTIIEKIDDHIQIAKDRGYKIKSFQLAQEEFEEYLKFKPGAAFTDKEKGFVFATHQGFTIRCALEKWSENKDLLVQSEVN